LKPSLLGRGGIEEEKVLDDWDEEPESRRLLGHGFGAELKLGGPCGLLVGGGGWSNKGGSACGRCATMRRDDKAPSDCCDLTLVFRGREKFSTTILGSIGVVCRLSAGDSRFETGAICSFCRARSGNFRIALGDVSTSGDSGMNGLDDRPGKADRGGLCVGVDSALVR
jgi:hypothetical protein